MYLFYFKIQCADRSSWMPKNLHPRTGRDETKGKTQERMERGSRKRSSSAGSEKMERVGDREKWKGIVRQAKTHSGL